MTIPRDELERRVIGVVAEVLAADPADIRLGSSLLDDLGTESIDFLEMEFRAEKEFDLVIGEAEMWQGTLDFESPRWMRDGMVTAEGVEELRRLQPDFDWSRFKGGIRRADLPRLITVRTIVDYVARRLAD